MKWILYIIAAYEGAVGVSEIVSNSTSNTTLSSLTALPSLGNLVPSTSSIGVSGAVDLGAAAVAFYFAHKM